MRQVMDSAFTLPATWKDLRRTSCPQMAAGIGYQCHLNCTHADGRSASRLKTYVGNALDTASRGPAWLASKAVPVAADGAGLFRNAAADAADRVALFRRRCGTVLPQMLTAQSEAVKP